MRLTSVTTIFYPFNKEESNTGAYEFRARITVSPAIVPQIKAVPKLVCRISNIPAVTCLITGGFKEF